LRHGRDACPNRWTAGKVLMLSAISFQTVTTSARAGVAINGPSRNQKYAVTGRS
jgi:hypothetical protein